jgi:hypothetical protein
VMKTINNMQTINIPPSINIFPELGRQGMEFSDAISELCDNSISANATDISIEIIGSWKEHSNGSLIKKGSKIRIIDNGNGINDIPTFISPALSSNSNSNYQRYMMSIYFNENR